jgi:hypothetical protein
VRLILSSLVVLILMSATGIAGQFHKCVSSGEVTYQQLPCAKAESEAKITGEVSIYVDQSNDRSRKKPTTSQTSIKPRSKNPNGRVVIVGRDRTACNASKESERRLRTKTYNNDAGSIARKLKSRARAIKQRMEKCR